MNLLQLIKRLNNYSINSALADFEVQGISCNSKKSGNNFIFIAIKGVNSDGNRFIEEAIAKGARAVVIESQEHKVPATKSGGSANNFGGTKPPEGVLFIGVNDARKACADLAAEFYGNPSEKIKIVGITGTNGKTTITYLLEAIIKAANKIPAVIGTINYRFKDNVIVSKNTTPGPIELQSMLSEMRGAGVDYCLMEVSSHALEQNRTEGIIFSSAIFTNLTQDHLDYHNTIENYFLAKARLFKGLSRDAFAIINADDSYSKRIKDLSSCGFIDYGIYNKAEVMATDIGVDISHTEFVLRASGRQIKLKTALIGVHNIYNILASISWAIKEGIALPVIKSAIEGFHCVPGRLERIDSKRGFSIFVDYAHTEDALYNVIRSLRPLARGRVIAVFGCGGGRDKIKRPKMGRVVTELADYAIITNDNPRLEEPLEIIEDVKKGIRSDNYCVIPDRRDAIKKSLSLAAAGDIVLIAGKGHETYQIVQDKTLEFDDREVVRRCLEEEFGVGS